MPEGANSEKFLQGPESARFSRRTFLKNTLAAAAAYPFLGSPEMAKGSSLPQESTLALETEAASIQQDGWNFMVNLEELQQYTAERNSTVQIDIIGGYGTNLPHIEYRQGKSHVSNQCIRLNLDGRSTGVMEVLPDPMQNHLLLSIKELQEEAITQSTSQLIELDSYGYVPQEENDRQRIWSEIDLDSAILEEVHERAKRFDIFQNMTYPTYIFQPRYGVQTPIYHSEDNYIMIPAKYFETPEDMEYGNIVLDHERFHAAHSSQALNSEEAKQADEELETAHQQAVKYITGEEPTVANEIFGQPEVKNHPIFTAFDESTYFPGLTTVDIHDHGHPFSNYRELFASAMNCMEKASEEVIAHIESIENLEDRKKAQELGSAAIQLATTIAGDEILVENAFPNIGIVKNYLQANT